MTFPPYMTDLRRHRALLRSTAALALLSSGGVAAHAQEAESVPATEQPAAAPAGGLGEIVVTASKRAENLQRAALSVTAVSERQLTSRGITDASQLAGLAPAVQFQPSFLLLTFIRGVGNYSSQPAVDQSIAYNVDGVYLDRPYAVPNILFDLERVELLRGPQGTLQGRNATGGSVNLITARPTMDFGAKASFSAGNYSLISTEGMINVPLSDNAALRLSAASTQHDGYFKNGFGDANTQGVRGRLLFKPTSRLEMLVTAEFTRRNEKGSTDSICPPGSMDVACQGVSWQPFQGTIGQGLNDDISINESQVLKSKNYAIYAEVNYDVGFATVTWVPNYRFHTYRSDQAYSRSFAYAPAVRDSMHSEEIRISSKAGSKFTWVAGYYFGRQNSKEQNYFLRADGPFIQSNEPDFDAVGHVYFKNDVDRYVYESQSVFGQVTVPVFEGFRATVGGRYTWDRKSLVGRTGVVVAPDTLVSVNVGDKLKLNRFTYKAGLEYDIAPRVLAYANISTGFKSGGINGVPAGSGLPTTFNPEKITAYQAGVKSRFLDNRIQVNAEGFLYNLNGFQTSSFGTTPEGIVIGFSVNSQTARLYGGEVETSFLITPNDRIDLSGSLLHANYREFIIPSIGLNLSGARMQNAPGGTFTGNYSHTFDLANGGSIVAHGEARYESSQWTDYRLTHGSLQKGYWREAADVTYNSPDGKWTLGAFIRNISNNGAIIAAAGGLGPYELALPLPPRTFGVRASANF